MEQEMYERFKQLSLNEKRFQFNQEMARIYELLVYYSKQKGFQEDRSKIINYDTESQKYIAETDYLDSSFENIINIRKVLMNYISWDENI